MASISRKRKSADAADAQGSLKRGKGDGGAKSEISDEVQVDSDGNMFWEISKTRRVTISDFKGKKLVNIREYYQQDNKWLPGKKGISMSIDQYSAFIGLLPQIEVLLRHQGETVPRPNYDGVVASQASTDAEDDDPSNCDERKLNHEATSDEDE